MSKRPQLDQDSTTTDSVTSKSSARKPQRRKGAGAPGRALAGDAAPKMSSVDHLVAEILRGLYEGRYVAGQKLTESELTQRFQMARGSVREAIRRLAAEGLVTLSLHRGASIRALTRDEVRDVLEIVEMLSGLSARLAAARLSSRDQEAALRDTLEGLKAHAAGLPLEFGRMRDRFYRQLAQLSGNQELARLLSTIQGHLVRVQFRDAYMGIEKQRLKDYERIVEAILARNGATAERVMRQHIRGTAQAIEQLPDHHFAL